MPGTDVRALLRATACGLVVLLSGALAAAAGPPPDPELGAVTGIERERDSVGRLRKISFDVWGDRYDLRVYEQAGGTPPVYVGRVRGQRRSWVTLIDRDGALEGIVVGETAAFGLAPASRYGRDAAVGDTVAYRIAPQLSAVARPGSPSRRSPAAAGAPAVGAAPAHSSSRRRPVGDAAPGDRGAPVGEPRASAVAGIAPAAFAALINPNALAAIGQENLVYNVLNQTGAATLFFPYDVVRDPSVAHTRLYVADAYNSRVVGYECVGTNCALATNASAARVYGQADATTWQSNGGVGSQVNAAHHNFPRGVAVSAQGTLYVADTGNNRVLVYANAWNDSVPDAVLGQSGFGTATAGSGLSQLRAPEGLAVDAAGALWVADTGNNRVLKFTTLSSGASAALSLGGSGAASATTLARPTGLAFDGAGNLYVADRDHSRVLRYAAPLTAGEAAAAAFGQGGALNSGVANLGGISATSLGFPEKVHVDGAGRLWIADTANNRVLEFDTPLSGATASRVIGQVSRTTVATFVTNVLDAPDGFPNAAGLHGPRGLLVDGGNRLWLCDRDNSRMLGFDNPVGAVPAALTADRILGHPLFLDASSNQASATRVNNPTGVAVDRSVSPNRLWAVDIGNNRVLGYNSTADITTNRAADLVLGQTNFSGGATNAGLNGVLQHAANASASATSLFYPSGVAVDSAGAVYVADSSNNRVLVFNDPFASDRTADRVFGQANFTALNPRFPYGTASSLTGPEGVHVDAADDLWVADTVNHRVVRFADAPSQPATTGSANLVLGQSAFVSSNTFPPYTPGCSATRFSGPAAVFHATSGRLYVADSGNHRVLMFSPPFVSGMSATAVFGQANLTSCNANRGGAASASTLNDPRGVIEDDAGNVLIGDYENHRVLVYYTPFSGGDLVADEVLGQPSFSANTVINPGPTSMYHPRGLALDAAGRLFVADVENSRVTRFAMDPAPVVILDPIPAPIVVGDFLTVTGTGFTAGSVIKLFVATPTGIRDFGPYTPNNWSAGYLIWQVDATLPLGNGFATMVIVNTDQGFAQSNGQSQLLYGDPTRNMPTITHINGTAISPPHPSIPLANVETVIAQGSTVTLTGTGFNGSLVNLFTSAGNYGPLTPLAGGTSTQLQVVVPANTPTGPGSFQAVNTPFTGNVSSNAVSVPIGAPVGITAISQTGTTVVVDGTGFSSLTVINLFARQNNALGNLGGLDAQGNARVPLTLVSPTRFQFTVPAGAQAGAAYVQVLNPPFIPFSSSGNDPDGAFTLVVP